MYNLLLETDQLGIATGNRQLVSDVSLSVGQGEIKGLVGESGSGKTLTALAIAGLLPEGIRVNNGHIQLHGTRGSIHLEGLPEKAMNRYRGASIAMVFQEPMTSLNPVLRCGYQAAEPLLIHTGMTKKQARERVIELFSEVGLPDPARIYHAWPHELSGGQRQRVMIAQALAASPSLLIADEPTTALDVTVQKKILELLAALKEKFNLGILFISHDLSVIGTIADSVAVMREGSIVEDGPVKKVLNEPQSPYTKGLLACKPSLQTHTRRLPTVKDYMEGNVPAAESGQRRSRLEPMTGSEPVLTVRNLGVAFGSEKRGKVKAVDGASFEIFAGETLGLVGESGSGKTTLGRSLLGLVKAQHGDISYRGVPLNQLSDRKFRAFRRKLQVVFQDPYSSLNPRMTVGSILGEVIRVHRLASGKAAVKQECIRLLEQVGLPGEAMARYPHEFSGGQRQRIGIARALACKPEFIVLDESVSALDVSIQAQVLNLLNDLKEEYGLTYLFISHDLTVVKYMADRILVMKSGVIVESGTSEQIWQDPRDPYTRQLLNAFPG